MTNLKNFFNKISNNNRIFTAEDLGKMSGDDYDKNEKAISFQLKNLGIPREHQLKYNQDVIHVNAYTKADGTEVQAHYRSKNGFPTGAASNLTGRDEEFDRPLNYQINGWDTGIPNIGNYWHYKQLNKQVEQEVGDFLRKNTPNPKLYSNDIRHQYASALYARNLGQKQADWLGNVNEVLSGGTTGSGAYDTKLDQLNNEIGRNYAKKYPNVTKEQLLQILLNDWEKNSQYTENRLRNKK